MPLDGPTDDAIIDRLRAATDADWAALWAAADEVAALEAPAQWFGGETRDGVIQMPYPEYDPAVFRLTGALTAITGGMVVFDWMDWDGVVRYQEPAAIADAPIADVPRLVTAIVRSERFGDGNLEGAIRSGVLGAIVARLRRWHDEGR